MAPLRDRETYCDALVRLLERDEHVVLRRVPMTPEHLRLFVPEPVFGAGPPTEPAQRHVVVSVVGSPEQANRLLEVLTAAGLGDNYGAGTLVNVEPPGVAAVWRRASSNGCDDRSPRPVSRSTARMQSPSCTTSTT
jgi:hypothetical protein